MRPCRTPVRRAWVIPIVVGVEQGQLGSIGCLEERCPLVEVGAANRVAVPGGFCVPCVDAPPEFVGGYVEVVQFDADVKATRCSPELITVGSCPEAEIEDDAQAEAQYLSGKVPEFMLELYTGRLVPGVGAEGNEPFILRDAQCASVRGQLRCERGLTRPWQPAGKHQSGLAHRGSQAGPHLPCSSRPLPVERRHGATTRNLIAARLERDAS